jgi:hypothetical protein
VQRALRHATLQITLETYVHLLAAPGTASGSVGDVLEPAAGKELNSG